MAPPPPPSGAPPLPTAGGLTQFNTLYLESCLGITDAGYATLVTALVGGALPALAKLKLENFDLHAPRLGCGWRVVMAQEHAALWEITHPPPLGSRAPFVMHVPPHPGLR